MRGSASRPGVSTRETQCRSALSAAYRSRSRWQRVRLRLSAESDACRQVWLEIRRFYPQQAEMMEATARASRVPVSWLVAILTGSLQDPRLLRTCWFFAAASAITDRGGLLARALARRCNRAAKPTRKRLPIDRVDAALADRSTRGGKRGGARGRVHVEFQRCHGVPACGTCGIGSRTIVCGVSTAWTGRSTGCWLDRVAGSRCWCWPTLLARLPE